MTKNSDLPLVSIVTPSYNQAQFLEQTMLSVLEQDYPRLEYLLVDGESSDGSLEIIHKYARRLTWWVSEKDAGQAEAINKGMRRASGEIVAWLNSDDTYLPGAIQQAVSVFMEHPQVGLAFGDVLAVDENGQTINHLRYGDWCLPDLMKFQVIGQPSVFMRRSLLEQAGYLDPSYHYLLDHQLWLRLAQLAEMRYIPSALSSARFHPGAKNVARAADFSREVYRILEWIESQPALADLVSANHRRIRAGAMRLSAFYLLEGGLARQSLAEYGRAFRWHAPTVLHDWRRVGYAKLCLLGLDRLGRYFRQRRRKANRF